jgi:hypothetical protein
VPAVLAYVFLCARLQGENPHSELIPHLMGKAGPTGFGSSTTAEQVASSWDGTGKVSHLVQHHLPLLVLDAWCHCMIQSHADQLICKYLYSSWHQCTPLQSMHWDTGGQLSCSVQNPYAAL